MPDGKEFHKSDVATVASLWWGPWGQGPSNNRQGPAKITGLIMFYLGCQIKTLVVLGIFQFFGAFLVLSKIENDEMFHGGCSKRLSHTHSRQISVMSFEMHCTGT